MLVVVVVVVAEDSFSNVKAVIYIIYTSPRLVCQPPAHGGGGSVVWFS